MSPFLHWAIDATLFGYGAAMLLALWRALRGPTAHDRILAMDFITVVATLALLVLGLRDLSRMYFEAALLLALFGFVSSAAFAKFLLRGEVIE